jgi:hypothetical protein
MKYPLAGSALAAAGLTAIALATLGPVVITGPVVRLPMICLLCGEFGTVDFVLNIALFVPLGFGLALAGVPPIRVVAMAGVLTLTIETLQATVIAGRHPALGDLVANAIGGLLGATAPRLIRAAWAPHRTVAVPLTLLTALLVLALAAAPVVLFRPSPSPTPTWWGQHAHDLEGTAPFEGTIRSVTLSGLPIIDGILPDQEAVKTRFHRLPLDFNAQVLSGPIPPEEAQIAAIADGAGGWVASIWQDGPDATARFRLRAADYLLRAPTLILRGAFAEPGVPVTIRLEATEEALSAVALRPGRPPLQVTMPVATTRGWILAWPWRTAFDGNPRTRTTAWLLVWWGVAGLLIAWWSGRTTGIPLLAALLGIALAGIPALTGSPIATWPEWATALAGAGVGVATAELPRLGEIATGRKRPSQ